MGDHVITPDELQSCNSKRSYAMNKDQVEGRIDQVKGNIKEVTGKVIGSDKLKAEGKADGVVGKVQDIVATPKKSSRTRSTTTSTKRSWPCRKSIKIRASISRCPDRKSVV